jgi:hypothetical protein
MRDKHESDFVININGCDALENNCRRALLNLEWRILSGLGHRMGVDRGEVESSGDEEDHSFHRLEAGVSTRLAFGGQTKFAGSGVPIPSRGLQSIRATPGNGCKAGRTVSGMTTRPD